DDLVYFEELCDALIEKNLDIKFGTHFRANITPILARKAKLAGFEDAWVGFEAFSDTELKEMNKGTNVNQNIETIESLTQAGVNVLAMLVVGFSDIETEKSNCQSIVQTIEHFSNRLYIIRFITWIITGILLSSSSIVAIVLGGLGIKKDDSPGLAIAGLVLGSLCVILWLFPL
ncbi:unnamed protein product, partial [marine sediment metagenome]